MTGLDRIRQTCRIHGIEFHEDIVGIPRCRQCDRDRHIEFVRAQAGPVTARAWQLSALPDRRPATDERRTRP